AGSALAPPPPGRSAAPPPASRALPDAPWLLTLLRAAAAFLLMLAPATAMGATLPLVVTALASRGEEFGRTLGRLYGWNTLGAVAGTLSGEMALVGRLGLTGTGIAAALLNLAACAAAFALSRSLPEEGRALVSAAPGREGSTRAHTAWRLGAAPARGGLVPALEGRWVP